MKCYNVQLAFISALLTKTDANVAANKIVLILVPLRGKLFEII